jgi:hypothetical protein
MTAAGTSFSRRACAGVSAIAVGAWQQAQWA